MRSRRSIVVALFVLYLAVLLDLTLFQFPQRRPPPNLIPFHSIIHDSRAGGREFVVNLVGNVVAFIPLGLALPVLRSRPTAARHVALAGFLLSTAIELTQYATGRRVADVDDVLLNTLGALLGYAFLRRTRRRAPVEIPLASAVGSGDDM